MFDIPRTKLSFHLFDDVIRSNTLIRVCGAVCRDDVIFLVNGFLILKDSLRGRNPILLNTYTEFHSLFTNQR